MNDGCYVCGSDKRLTKFQYPKDVKIVCVDCYKALETGHREYRRKKEAGEI